MDSIVLYATGDTQNKKKDTIKIIQKIKINKMNLKKNTPGYDVGPRVVRRVPQRRTTSFSLNFP
jgi:hypothetical protein